MTYNWTNAYNIERLHKGHFFDPSAMRFFNSKLPDGGFETETEIYFVTSEKFDRLAKRLYTMRVLNKASGSINTVGEFQAYKTKKAAEKAIEKMLKACNA